MEYPLEKLVKSVGGKISSALEYGRGIYKESLVNLKPEALCISACTSAEIVAASIAYYAGKAMEVTDQNPFLQNIGEFSASYSNELGIPAAIAAGTLYAYNHVKKDAKIHNVEPSFQDIAYWVGTTESICIITAVTIEYFGSKYFGNPLTGPLDLPNLSIELLAWGLAFPIATAAMSVLTFDKKKEAKRWVAKKNALENKVTEINKGKISGKIIEKNLPQIYVNLEKGITPETYSLYSAESPRAKYSGKERKSISDLAIEVFEETEVPYEVVENPFVHEPPNERS